MMIRKIQALLTAMVLCAAATAAQKAEHFGAAFTDAKTVSLKEILSDVGTFSGKTIKVEGEITEVCQAKGCWLVVTDGKQEMRVKFKDYGFFVPKDASGRKVILEGIVEKKTISEDHAKHIAEESGGKQDPVKIKGPQEIIQMTAAGVEILN
ncbi:MAG: DUF4920 domain-containing protein [Acidobacteriota bacterium]